MFSTSGDIQYIEVCSVHREVFSTLGECSVHWGVFSTLGEYHEYIGGCSVHQRDTMSTLGREDIMSTLRNIHYIGGYHDAFGDTMSTSGDVQYIRGYHEYTKVFNRN